jgi:hypothetical protein
MERRYLRSQRAGGSRTRQGRGLQCVTMSSLSCCPMPSTSSLPLLPCPRDPRLHPEDQRLLANLARSAAALLGHVQAGDIPQRISNEVKASLADRDTIGIARGVLMERFDLDKQAAMNRLIDLTTDARVTIGAMPAMISERTPPRGTTTPYPGRHPRCRYKRAGRLDPVLRAGRRPGRIQHRRLPSRPYAPAGPGLRRTVRTRARTEEYLRRAG